MELNYYSIPLVFYIDREMIIFQHSFILKWMITHWLHPSLLRALKRYTGASRGQKAQPEEAVSKRFAFAHVPAWNSANRMQLRFGCKR